MKTKNALLGALLIISMVFMGCNSNNVKIQNVTSSKKDLEISIETTDKLLYYAVKDIVGDRHMVEYMFSNEEDLKNYSFTDDSINNIEKKDLFIYYGSNFEPWSDKFIEKLSKTNLGIISASRGIKILTYSTDENDKKTYGKDIPYYWLSIDNYKVLLQNIKNAVEEKDPKNRSIYEKNFSDELKSIDKYAKQLKDILDNLDSYTFIIDGDDLDYFLKYTGVKYVKVSDGNYQAVSDKIKDNAKLIYLYCDDSKLGEDSVFIKVNNIKTIKIDNYSDKKSYKDILKENIDNLKSLKK